MVKSLRFLTIFTAAIRHQGTWQLYSILKDSDKYKNTVRVCNLHADHIKIFPFYNGHKQCWQVHCVV